MSNLLEQAIIDAAALREVAMKNAESALIEKYSKEFNDSVQKLLEQEMPADPAAATADPAADPLSSPNIADPNAIATASPIDSEKEEAFEDVPSSFLEGDDAEVITIDFDQLKKQVSNAMGMGSSLLASPQAAPTPAAPEAAAQPMMENLEIGEDELEEVYDTGLTQDVAEDALAEEEEKELDEKLVIKVKDVLNSESEQELEYEFEGWNGEEELEEIIDPTAAANAVANAEEIAGKAKSNYFKSIGEREKEMSASNTTAEDIQITEEELVELAEELKVDIHPENLSDGHMGTTVTQKREQRNLELAAARDAKAEEDRAEEIRKMKDLESKLEEAIELGTELVTENEELRTKLSEIESNLVALKENTEKLSISNAKLLYTNKVLGDVSLNERQKGQIVENISKSTSVLEAKTIYNTLQGTVATVSSEKKSKESLSEALIHGNSPFLTRKKQEHDIPFAERMKLLAGITNKS